MASAKQLLLTGGSGFVGSHLVPAAMHAGYRVTLLNRGTRRIQGVDQIVADRTKADEMFRAAEGNKTFHAVVDTSSYSERDSKLAWEAFAGLTQHWIHLSSASVYRETVGRDPSERDPIGGAAVWGEYGVDKSAADAFLLARKEHAPVTIFRPPYLYGPRNDNDRERFVWSRCLRGESIVIPGDGKTKIQFLHAADLAGAILAAAAEPPQASVVYNLAADEKISLSDWVLIAAKAAGCADPGHIAGAAAEGFTPRQYFPFRDYPCCVEVNAVKSCLDWRAKFSLEEGLKATFQSYPRSDLMAGSKPSNAELSILEKISAAKRRS